MFFLIKKHNRFVVAVIISALVYCVCLRASETPIHSFNAQLILAGKIKQLSRENKKALAVRCRLIGIPYDSKSEVWFAQVRSVTIRNYNGDVIDWIAYPPLMDSHRCFKGEKFYLANASFPQYVPHTWLTDDQGVSKGEVVVASQKPEASIVHFTVFTKPATNRRKK